MPKVEFIGSSARDQTNAKANPSRLVNGYREPVMPGGKGPFVLRSVPGMDLLAALPGVFVRDMVLFEGKAFVACGGDLYSVGSDGATTNVGAVDDDAKTSMAENNGTLTIVAGGVYRTSDGATVSAPIATGSVTDAGSVAYLGGYTLVSELNGRKVQWSGLVDPATFNGLDFASAEITTDPIIRIIAFKDALYIFKATGFERWAVTGQPGANAFARIDGAQSEPGLAGFGLITSYPNGFAYVATDGKVYALADGLRPISTPPVEVALTENTPERLFFYERRGHGFICLVFSDAYAWCYDIATGEWHERAEAEGPWTAKASVKLGNDWLVGTDSGKVAKLSPICTDFGLPLVREYTSFTLDGEERFCIDSIEAFPRVGIDKQAAADLSNASVTLQMSRDGGFTWGAEKPRDVGVTGAYATRLTWRALGQYRTATARFTLSSEADIPLLASINLGMS
jgi:hypothetical protein